MRATAGLLYSSTPPSQQPALCSGRRPGAPVRLSSQAAPTRMWGWGVGPDASAEIVAPVPASRLDPASHPGRQPRACPGLGRVLLPPHIGPLPRSRASAAGAGEPFLCGRRRAVAVFLVCQGYGTALHTLADSEVLVLPQPSIFPPCRERTTLRALTSAAHGRARGALVSTDGSPRGPARTTTIASRAGARVGDPDRRTLQLRATAGGGTSAVCRSARLLRPALGLPCRPPLRGGGAAYLTGLVLEGCTSPSRPAAGVARAGRAEEIDL